MAKVYGVTFLGAPRTKEAENACCAGADGVSVVALALCCMIGGVAAPWLLPLLGAPFRCRWRRRHHRFSADDRAAADCLPAAAVRADAVFKATVSRSRGARHGCGYEHEQSMVITAHGFAMPVKEPLRRAEAAPLAEPVGWFRAGRVLPRRRCSAAGAD
jgi:formate hydrogenlyase subunit 3